MNTGAKWTIGIIIFLLVFIIFGFTAPIKTQAYSEKQTIWVTEAYLDKEPYEEIVYETANVLYTYTAPCEEQRFGSGYGCCGVNAEGRIGVPGNQMPTYQYPPLGDPAYNPYANKPPVRYCEYVVVRPETKAWTVTKVRDVVKTKTVPKEETVIKYKKVPLFS